MEQVIAALPPPLPQKALVAGVCILALVKVEKAV
jgi:hypothetical protein